MLMTGVLCTVCGAQVYVYIGTADFVALVDSLQNLRFDITINARTINYFILMFEKTKKIERRDIYFMKCVFYFNQLFLLRHSAYLCHKVYNT